MNERQDPPRPPTPIRESAPDTGSGPIDDRNPGEDLDGAGAVSPEGDRRPTPVRTVMETDEEPEAQPQAPELFRTFSDPRTGTEWTAEVTGWSMSGVLPLRTVPILEVVFRNNEPGAPPQKRIVHQGENLSGFTEAELVELFSRAEAYREPSMSPDPDRSTPKSGRTKGRKG